MFSRLMPCFGNHLLVYSTAAVGWKVRLTSDALPTLQSCPLPHTDSLTPVCPLSEYSSNQFIYLISTDILHNDPLKKTDLPGHCRKVSVK